MLSPSCENEYDGVLFQFACLANWTPRFMVESGRLRRRKYSSTTFCEITAPTLGNGNARSTLFPAATGLTLLHHGTLTYGR
jgi:hypothetical protein